jgi:hypothetical protein
MFIRMYVCACVCVCMCVCVCVCVCACVRVCVRVYIHTYIHVYICIILTSVTSRAPVAVHIQVLDPYGDVIPGAEATIYIALPPAENEVSLQPLCTNFTQLNFTA